MAHFNLDKLVRIYVKDYTESVRYDYVTEKRFLGIRVRKEGFVDTWYGDYLKELPSDYTFKDGKVYAKPICKLNFQEGYELEYVFDNFKEAVKFRDETIAGRNYIES